MNSIYDNIVTLYQSVLKGLLFGLVPTLLMAALVFFSQLICKREPKAALIPAAFTTFGTVIGILVGDSRESVVGDALPLVVAMVTLFITFIVEKKGQDDIRTLYMLSLLGFFLGTVFGAIYGAALRTA
jgi:hypothetical protein